ncbi:MAG: YkoP family protein [Candidatus Binataceae bacterium]
MMWRMISHGSNPGSAHGLLTAWSGWERISHYLWPTTGIPAAPYQLLELRVGPYSGKSFVLGDGTKIEQDLLIGELHCNNHNIFRLVVERGVNPYSATREDLRSLALWISQDETGRQVRALYGVTMLTKGALRLGFTIRRQPINLRRRFERIFMTGLLLLYTTGNVQRLMRGATPCTYPQEIWMSRRELIRRYGDRPARLSDPFDRPADSSPSFMS